MSLEEELNREFQIFFDNCKSRNLSSTEMKVICKYLERKTLWKQLRIEINFMIVIILIYLIYINCEVFAWYITALGRIFLIQLLPYWDWTYLYNQQCLIENIKTTENLRYYSNDCPACNSGGKYLH